MRPATRRELLTRGGAAAGALAGGGLLLAASAAANDPFSGESGAEGSDSTTAGGDSPRRLLSHALMVEGLAQFAFTYGEKHFSLTPHGRSVLRQLARHERAHARALERALERFGGPDTTAAPAGPPRDVDAADHLLDVLNIDGSLVELHDSKHALELLLRIEYAQEGAYYRAVEKLSDPVMALMAAEVLAVEAQHVVLLRELHQPGYLEGAAPDSFVVGPR